MTATLARALSPRPAVPSAITLNRLGPSEPAQNPCLLVDDDGVLLACLSRTFRLRGYDVVVARTAGEATRAVTAGQFAFIVLDVRLGDADGLGVLRAIRRYAAHERTPVVILSGRDDHPTICGAFRLGADDYMVKPLAFDEVASRVAGLLWARN